MGTKNGDSYLPITSGELVVFMETADAMMRSVSWSPTKSLARGERGIEFQSISAPARMSEAQSLTALAAEICGGSIILSPEANKVLSTVRNGICVGLHLANQYAKRSGLDILRQSNSAGKLSGAQQVEFNEKTTMASAIALFTASSYMVHELSAYEADKISGLHLDLPGIPETAYQNPQKSLMCAMFYFARYTSKEARLVNNDLEFVKLAILYFRAMASEVYDKRSSFRHEEAFTEVSYKMEDSDFVVKGFELIEKTSVISVEFRRVSFDQIVGNRRAKHQAIRTAMMLCCYDLARKANPFQEFGNFPSIRMGEGVAGTGKSMQIAATATKIEELCEKIGLPFRFWPMPAAIVSTFQGGSAERMEEYWRPLRDPDKIIYGVADDAENCFMNRAKEGISAGIREVISVFLRSTEGASAINRGNSVFELFTNLPEILDPAVLSRVQARFPINGAETVEDFMDQDFLWHRGLAKLNPDFVGMTNTTGYEFLAAQKAVKNLVDLEAVSGTYTVNDPAVREALEIAGKKFPTTDHGFYGHLFTEVRRRYKRFSSRDVRNIQSAIDARIFDFDLPAEWFDDVKMFYGQDYDTKVAMLKVVLLENMRGLKLPEIRYQETLRYLDTLAKITNVEFERDVDTMVGRIKVDEEARRRFINAKNAK